ncbi:hypothetical protein [Natranaerobius thermophilus]|uniref:hypothetical protein n=1 Tax=Natranaerobius thermophilus TaxID=375929 RepID=UPI002F414B7C
MVKHFWKISLESKERYRESDVVSGIDGRHERIEQSEELMESFGSLIYIYVLFGVILCFAIIYPVL